MARALPFAAPSCVIRAHVAENAAFLAHKVQEVGLCFFEARSCMAYTQEDMPPSLKALPLRWHMHLPVDLPWGAGQKGGSKAAHMALAVAEKAAYLRPRFGVLHPPTAQQILGKNAESKAQEVQDIHEKIQELLYDFWRIWKAESPVPVLLENIEGADMQEFSPSLFGIKEQGPASKLEGAAYGICLDVGHMLAFGQQGILQRPDLLRKVQLLHWSAPGKRDEHLPLTEFTLPQWALVQQLVALLPAQATHMIEVFNWQGIETSAPILQRLLRGEYA